MSDEEKRKAYLFYNELELDNKNEIHFAYYAECSSTYCEGLFLMWYPMSLNLFLEKIGV